jgi:hypothetical protein
MRKNGKTGTNIPEITPQALKPVPCKKNMSFYTDSWALMRETSSTQD